MQDELLKRAATLMTEQIAAYGRLSSICSQLMVALARDVPEAIESVVRAGDAEMLRMRARLVELVNTLAAFADARSAHPAPISDEARAAFEKASAELLDAARRFQRIRRRAATLANNGSVFTAACMEMHGVRPVTYSLPLTRGSTKWA
jgi:hypothetical protein